MILTARASHHKALAFFYSPTDADSKFQVQGGRFLLLTADGAFALGLAWRRCSSSVAREFLGIRTRSAYIPECSRRTSGGRGFARHMVGSGKSRL